jgi:hypothetical protein
MVSKRRSTEDLDADADAAPALDARAAAFHAKRECAS